MPRKQRGNGITSDIVKFVKDNKLISTTLGLIPDSRAQIASNVAKMVGLGKRKKSRRQGGKGIFSDIGNGLGGAAFGLGSGLGGLAHGLFGAGKKPKKKVISM